MANSKTTAKAQGAFAEMLARSGDSIAADRGARITKQAKIAYEDDLRRMENKLLNLQDQREIMLDQSPDNRFSLKPGQTFDARSWVAEYQRLSVDIATTVEEIAIAEESIKFLFG